MLILCLKKIFMRKPRTKHWFLVRKVGSLLRSLASTGDQFFGIIVDFQLKLSHYVVLEVWMKKGYMLPYLWTHAILVGYTEVRQIKGINSLKRDFDFKFQSFKVDQTMV